MSRTARITDILTNSLQPSQMELVNDSGKHKGHAGANPKGDSHYTLNVTSDKFRGMTKVQRHQLIYKLLDSEFKAGLHALSIVAKTPDEA